MWARSDGTASQGPSSIPASAPARSRRVLEFFSGIGGLHYALARSGVMCFEVLRAFDLDDAAVRTYRHNHPGTPVSTANIGSLKSAELVALAGDCWLLSPPCQPYTRQGLQLGIADGRSSALTHLVDLLERAGGEGEGEGKGEGEGVAAADGAPLLPDSLLLENVVGFESSPMRQRLHAVLVARGYHVREVWASPAHFGVPNQRTRYFLLASRVGELQAPPPPPIAALLLDPATLEKACAMGIPLEPPHGEVDAETQQACAPLGDYLLPAPAPADAATAAAAAAAAAAGDTACCVDCCAVAEHILERYGAAMDLVCRTSRRSTCFTKNYSRYIKGTGSVVCEAVDPGVALPDHEDKCLEVLRPLKPRFFAPREVANLHGFPAEFAFPKEVSRKKQYELLGNSLSVQVVAELLRYLLGGGARLA